MVRLHCYCLPASCLLLSSHACPVPIAALPPGVYPVLTPKTFSLISDQSIPSGSIYRINTGSPLPKGTNAVVMVEDTELVKTSPGPDGEEEDEVEVKLLAGAQTGENVRAAGSDVKEGELVLQKGTLISSLGGEVGTLAFVGQRKVRTQRLNCTEFVSGKLPDPCENSRRL